MSLDVPNGFFDLGLDQKANGGKAQSGKRDIPMFFMLTKFH